MSEPHMMAEHEYSSEYPGDQTQPTAEILNALNAVKSEPPADITTPTEYDALTAQVREKPHNPEAWRRLIDVAENTGEIEKIRAAFDALLQQYPNTVCDTRVFLVRSFVDSFFSPRRKSSTSAIFSMTRTRSERPKSCSRNFSGLHLRSTYGNST
jgi:hypothetical protein